MIFHKIKKTPWRNKKTLVFSGFVFLCGFFVFPVFAIDLDGDGLASEIDNTDSIVLATPIISFPKERQAVFDENLLAPFWGTAEVGTTTKIFEEGTQVCTGAVSGNGISIGDGSYGKVDTIEFLAENISAQLFYDTRQDSLSNTWRTDRGAGVTWYNETKDDGADSACDYRTGDDDNSDGDIDEDDDPRGGSDDRCGSTDFPAQVLLFATTGKLSLFDAEKQIFWKSFSLSGGVTLAANNGVIFAGTANGFSVYDFVNDSFVDVLTTASSPAIIHNSVTDIYAKTIEDKDYIVIGTGGGITIYNITDGSVVSKTTSAIDGISITSDNKLLYAIDDTTFISTVSVVSLGNNWTEEEGISANVNFEGGIVNTVYEDFVGHSEGLTQISSGYKNIEDGLVYREFFESLSGITSNVYQSGTVQGGPTILNNEITLNGTTDYITLNSLRSEIKTVSFWIEAETLTEDIFDFDEGTHTIEVTSGTVSATGFDTPSMYVDGEISTTIDTNLRHVVITTDTGITLSNATIGKETDFFQGKMKDIRFYNRVLSASEVATSFANGGTAFLSYKYLTPTYTTFSMLGAEQGVWLDGGTDRSGSGNNLTNNGSVTISAVASGAEMQQFTFNGTSNYLSSSDTDFNITGDEITVGMWIKRPTTGGTGPYQKILTHGTSIETRSYFLSAGDNFFNYPFAEDPYFFGIRTDQGFQAASIQTTPAADTWEFIVGTYDGTNVRIYRNGALEEVNSHTGNIVSVTEDLRIGYGYDSEYFSGSVALPFVVNEAYSSDQILSLYNTTTNWFSENTKMFLQSTSEVVVDVVQDSLRNKAYILSESGITELNTSTLATSEILSQASLTSIAPTYISNWECSATINPGSHTVFARTYMGANASTVVSSDRSFYIYESGVPDLDGDGLANLYEDEEGEIKGEDHDNDANIPIQTPVIVSVVRDSEDSYEYTISGTGDPLWKGTVPTRVAIFVEGEEAPRDFFDITETVGTWQSEALTFVVGEHTIFVRAYVGENASNVDSEETAFEVVTIEAGPPTVNTLPTFVGSNSVSFTWASEVPSAQFYAEMSMDENFETITQNSGWIPETSYDFQNLSNGTMYYYRVKLRDAGGEETIFSEIVSTTIDTQAPVEGTVANQSAYSAETNIIFSWNNFTDTGGSGVDHYEVQISDENNFSNIVFEDNHYIRVNHTYAGTQGETYYARVKAVDGVALKSDFVYSDGTTIDTTAPTEFALDVHQHPAPVGDQIITWSASTDGESGIQQYEIFREDNIFDASRNVQLSVPMHSMGTTTTTTFIDTTTVDDEFYVYKIIATNNAGIETETATMQFHVSSTETYPPAFENAVSYSTTDTVVVDWLTADDISNITAYEVLRDDVVIHTTVDADTTVYTDTEAKVDGQSYNYTVRAKSATETGGKSVIMSVLIDKTDPVTTSSISGTPSEGGWYSVPVIATLGATDDESGVSETLFNKNSAGIAPYVVPILFNMNGVNTLSVFSIDKAGNSETPQDIEVKVDSLAPTATFALALDLTTNNGFVAANSTAFTSTGVDVNSGIDSIVTYARFDQNGDEALSGDNDFDFTQISTTETSPDTGTYYFTDDGTADGTNQDGEYSFKVISTDLAGNTRESTVVIVKVDRTVPVTMHDAPTEIPPTTPFTITLTPSDAPVSSGVAQTYYTTDGTTPTTESTTGTSILSENITFDGDYYTVKYFSVDNLGNAENVKTATNQPTDTDSDLMPDWWEDLYGLDKNNPSDASTDVDSDTLTNLQEYQANTNPTKTDSDGDSVFDGTESTDGTDPSDSSDHRVLLLFPQTTSEKTTDTPFTFIAKAPVGRHVAVKNASGEVIATGVADASGRTFIELPLEAGTHTLSAEFIHTDGQVVKAPGFVFYVAEDGENPVFNNLIDDQLFIQGFIDLTLNGKASAKLEIFEIKDGNLNSLTQDDTTAVGLGIITFPNTFLEGQILVLDQTNALTSQIIDVQRGVHVTGQLLNTNSEPVQGVIVKFIDGGYSFETTTDWQGEYSLNIPGDSEYLVRMYNPMYLKYEETIALEREDLRISPILELLTDPGKIQGEYGLIDIDPSGKIALRWAGMKQDELLRIAEKGYKFALEQVKQLNEGVEGEIVTRTDAYGRDLFVGYKSGRLAVDEFKVQPYVAQRVTGLLGAERRTLDGGESYLASAKKEGICLNEKPRLEYCSDVSQRHLYVEDIMIMDSYGVIHIDEENKFKPNDTVTWSQVLQLLFAANCIPTEDYPTLKKAQLPEILDFPLQNKLESLLFYTAMKEGIIDLKILPEEPPTREEVLLAMSSVFPLDINPKAKTTSYSDVLKNDPLAPMLVAAKQAGWFKTFASGRFFYHNKKITRGEFATWFVQAVNHKKETFTPENAFKRFLLKFRGEEKEEQGRLGTRRMKSSDIETYLRTREYYDQKEVAPYYYPTRNSWNPLDPNSGREQIKLDNENDVKIKRMEKPKILRE